MPAEVHRSPASPRVTRRALLLALASGAALAACGSPASAPSSTAAAATSPAVAAATTPAPTAAAAPAATPGAATPAAAAGAPPKGTLRIAQGIEFTSSLDARKNAFQLIRIGVAETLTKPTPKNEIVPWLAESVKNVDPTTWRVTLRKNAKFWDGSPVTAQAVTDAFQADWKAYAVADGLLSKDTKITPVDATTLDFVTPAPIGNLPNVLSAQFFVVHKDGTTMTGPYKPTNLQAGQQLDMQAFADHWAGAPPIATVTVRKVTDGNARVLALQSGDVDLIDNIPPQAVKQLGPGFWTVNIPAGREDYVVLNHAQPPFNDPAVCQALALGIDRQALLTIGLAGLGTVATGIFPPDQGVQTVPMQQTDASKAKQVLDQAGYAMGPDGVRAKGSTKLAFTLYTSDVRPEWTPMAEAIQSQLKPLGFSIKLQQVQNVGDLLSQNKSFEAAMYSANSLVTGDPLYFLNQTLIKGGPANYGSYSDPDVEAVVAKLRTETDPAKRQQLVVQAQQAAQADVPNAYLVVIPILAAGKDNVKGYVPNPNDLYFFDGSIKLA